MSFKLIDDPRVIIYDHNRVIIQATGASDGISTLDHRIVGQVFYYCAAKVQAKSILNCNREYYRGKYHCTVDLLFDWFRIMTTENFCFYLQKRLIQTSQTGGQWYSDASPFSIP